MKKYILKLVFINLFLIFNVNSSTLMRIDSKIVNNIEVIQEENSNHQIIYEESNHIKTNEELINFSPTLESQFESFTQNYTKRDHYTKEVTKITKNKITGEEISVEKYTQPYFVDNTMTRFVDVILKSTQNELLECLDWTPKENTIAFGEYFNQNRECQEKISKNYEYSHNSEILAKHTINTVELKKIESRESEGTLVNFTKELIYNGSDLTYRVFTGNGCWNDAGNGFFYLGRGSGGQCGVVLKDKRTNTDILSNIDANKTTAIEFQVYSSNPIYHSYFMTDIGGFVVARDGTKFLGSNQGCSNWWYSTCSMAASTPRISIFDWNNANNVYKILFHKNNIYLYINNVLYKKSPFIYNGGNTAFYMAANSGWVAIKYFSIKSN